MLQLKHVYSSSPTQIAVHHLRLPRQGRSFIVYPSADAVVVCDPHSLRLVRVLAFSEAYPGAGRPSEPLTSVAVDASMTLVLAAMNTRIAAWSLSDLQQDTWRIHSTLILPEGYDVTTLDCRAGLLAVGTRFSLSVYTLVLENDLLTWSQKWTLSTTPPAIIRFSPSLMYLATISEFDRMVRLYSTASGRQIQSIPHPRPITNLAWRHPASSRDDLVLYTTTSDAVIRVFLPILDSPQHLQLHASLDLYSALPSHSPSAHLQQIPSTVFWLDREIIGKALDHLLERTLSEDSTSKTHIKETRDTGWDFFLRVLHDGSVIVTAIANIDRRPPTLLRQYTLQRLPPSTLPHMPIYLVAIPSSKPGNISLVTAPPLSVFDLSPLLFFDLHPESLDGMTLSAKMMERVATEEKEITSLMRTSEGSGLGVKRFGDIGEAWRIVDHGSKLVRSSTWQSVDLVVVLQEGRTFATYTLVNELLELHSTPPQSLHIPKITRLFSLPSRVGCEFLVGITAEFSIITLHATYEPSPSLTIRSQVKLPLPLSPPKTILPVDSMAWGSDDLRTEYDTLLSISTEGELAFWLPEESVGNSWRCTGKVRTGRVDIKKANCSSAKKTALIVSGPVGDELTIWNSQESEFATGLEFRGTYSDSINDLDWTSTPDMQSILAVGFLHRVELLCQQRLTYFDAGPGWATCAVIDIGNFIPYQIRDSIWLSRGSLVIAAGHQLLLYGAPPPSPVNEQEPPPDTLFEYAARHNGPLDDYHPQMVLQCLLWEKVELVKEIIVNLSRALSGPSSKRKRLEWRPLPVERFLKKEDNLNNNSKQRKRYTALFEAPQPEDSDEPEEERFSRPLVNGLISTLEAFPLPHLTPNEQAHLLTLIQTTLEVEEQRRSLDSNGLRYLISMRSFYILNHRASSSSSPQSKGTIPRSTGHRERIRYRDMIWAFHSESQDLLLNASTAACKGKMLWSDARALGISIWLTSIEALKSQMEVIARNEYMLDDSRDPTRCSLYYFALGRVKLVHGLWRQASWHKEQASTLRFLSNDFSEPRWRTAALKNAFALLSKQRYEYAAAFFLLGGSLKDAVNVCIRQLNDFQLAVALARVVEQSDDGPFLLDILKGTVLPIAFKDGNRWLASWGFWLLHRRDLAVRVLLTPLQDLATALDIEVTEIGEPHYDDPSLALLFSQLRSKTLQAAKGTSEISGRLEFNFVLQMARVFCRMGCHVLALDLVRSWTFDQPSMIPASIPGEKSWSPTISPARSSFLDHRRSSTIMIDMRITSLPPTRSPSPGLVEGMAVVDEEPTQDDQDLLARKAGLGNLMRSAKQHVTVPEFDMNSFI